MRFVGAIFSLGIIFVVLVDAFETILQPRRVTRPYRFARLFYRNTWLFWRRVAARVPAGRHREAFLSIYGPLSLLGLFVSWICALIFGFALMHWSLGSLLHTPSGASTFHSDVYFSATT